MSIANLLSFYYFLTKFLNKALWVTTVVSLHAQISALDMDRVAPMANAFATNFGLEMTAQSFHALQIAILRYSMNT